MFDDLDASVASLVTAELASVTSAVPTVDFLRPGDDGFDATPKKPRLNLFMFRLDEDSSRRTPEWTDVRDADGRVIGRRPPTRWINVRYVATGWSSDPATEHRVLSELMRAFVTDRLIGADHRLGVFADDEQLIESGDQLLVTCMPLGPAAGPLRPIELGMRPALELSVVVPIRATVSTDVGPPAREFAMVVDGGHGRTRRSRSVVVGSSDDPTREPKEWVATQIEEKISGA